MSDAKLQRSIETATDEQRSRIHDRPLDRGDVLGRYVVLSRVGAGAMGVVYAAYDPELDRKVAVKLLHSAHEGSTDASDGHRRLMREAQALARVGHPNVITIHDVGEHDGRVFLAMEFVQGRTLAMWRTAAQRRWRETLDVYLQAGRGLAAAHQAGLVHRDFKPDNVMLGDDGTVRVMDFGLARPAELGSAGVSESVDERPTTSALSAELTRAGSVIGTPAYMAPEQHLGLPVDEKCDQFSYCVSLWEALFGERPFVGRSMAELAHAVTSATPRVPARAKDAPAWLRRVILRGLDRSVAARYPSMTVLLGALERGHGLARRRRLVVAGVAVFAAGGLGMGAVALDRRAREQACARAGDVVDEVWNADVRAQLHDAFARSELVYAGALADKVTPWFDAASESWRTARTETCVAAEVDRVIDADGAARSVWCLDDQKAQIEAMLVELVAGDPVSVRGAVAAAAALPRADACRESRLLAQLPDADRRDEVQALQPELARAAALSLAGKHTVSLAIAKEVLVRADALEWPPLKAVAQLRVGHAQAGTADFAAAEASLQNAYFTALDAGVSSVAVDAGNELIAVVGVQLARADDGMLWSRLAESGLTAIGPEDRVRLATHVGNTASVRADQAAYEDAKQLHARALALREEALGPGHPDVARSVSSLARVDQRLGELDAARAGFERALDIQTRALGTEHPDVAAAMADLASTHRRAKAQPLAEQALAIRERALGPDHAEVAASLTQLGDLHHNDNELEEANRLYERAHAITERIFGADHPNVASTINSLANIDFASGRYDVATQRYGRALAIHERVYGPDHPQLVPYVGNLASATQASGDLPSALALNMRTLAILEKAFGVDHPDIAFCLDNLARIYLMLDRVDDARTVRMRALAIVEGTVGPGNPAIAMVLSNLAVVERIAARHAVAKALEERSLSIREGAFGSEHHSLAWPLVGLAETAIAERRFDEAHALADRAVRLRQVEGPTAGARADALYARAQASWGTGDRASARIDAQQAATLYRSDTHAADRAAVVEQWLAKVGRTSR